MNARAFSLFEALAATALLAVIAAACMPLLRAPQRTAAMHADDELARLADELAERAAKHPESFSIDLEAAATFSLAWPKDLQQEADESKTVLPNASATVLMPDGAGVARDRWISVRCGDATSIRWALAPEKKKGEKKNMRRGLRRAPVKRRPGMTLIETVVALAVTAFLASAVAAWTTSAARFAATAASRESSGSAQEAIMRLIDDDLASVDIDAIQESRGGRAAGGEREDRVRVDDGALVLRTRSSLPDREGPVARRYEHDGIAMTLAARDALPDGATRMTVLAHDVTKWEVKLETQAADRRDRSREAQRVLTVTIAVGASPPTTIRRIVR